SSTRWPVGASASARLLDTTVLPSPGPLLVTTSDWPPSAVDENSTLVRTVRIASAKFGVAPLSSSGVDSPSATLIFGTMPMNGRPRWALISVGDLMRLSQYSKKNARPIALIDAPMRARNRASGLSGLDGSFGTFAALPT